MFFVIASHLRLHFKSAGAELPVFQGDIDAQT